MPSKLITPSDLGVEFQVSEKVTSIWTARSSPRRTNARRRTARAPTHGRPRPTPEPPLPVLRRGANGRDRRRRWGAGRRRHRRRGAGGLRGRLAIGLLAPPPPPPRAPGQGGRQPLLPRRRPPPRPLSAGRPGRPLELRGRCRRSPCRPTAFRRRDRTLRVDRGVATRLLHVEGSPVLVRAWQPGRRPRAAAGRAGDPDAVALPAAGGTRRRSSAGRTRPSGGRDRADALRARRRRRPQRLPPPLPPRPAARPAVAADAELPAAAAAVALGGAGRGDRRAADRGRARGPDRTPHRRPLGPRLAEGAARCATSRRRRRSPAAPPPNWPRWTWPRAGSTALRRDRPAGRRRALSDPRPPDADRRLLAMPQIGPWTVQCLGLFGRGEMDSLPAGDLGYIKLVGRLAGLGRRATVAEVEEFYAPYELGGRRAHPRRAGVVRRAHDARCLKASRGASVDKTGDASVSITTAMREPGTGTGPTTRSTNSSTRSPPAGRTTGAWSSGCR